MTAAAAPPLRCRVCGSADVTPLGRPAHHLPTTVAGVPIDLTDLQLTLCRCRSCNYAFIDPLIPEQRLLDCYRRSAGSHWTTDSSVAELRFYARKRQLLSQFSPGKVVLDFGCYDGGFLAYLGPDFDRSGVEPSIPAADRARQHGVQILGPTIDSVDPTALKPFDAIIVFDVMEHLGDPVATLTSLAKLLRSGGIILIETGNTDAPEFHRLGPLYAYAAIAEHVGFFNQSSLREAGRRAGLELAHFETSQHSTYPHHPLKFRLVNTAYWILRALSKLRFPLPQRLGRIALGPVPRTLDPRDHFLAVLRRPT
jgi:SAM-dependent methyltransferase